MCRTACISLSAFALIAGSIAFAQPAAKDAKQPAKPAAAQPAGPSAEDMKCYMEAGTPGKMHEFLAKNVGTWSGKNKMWMAEGAEPMVSECTSTTTAMMDGKFFKCEISGDMGPMGPFTGTGITGFDNVSQKFQSSWVDNMGTGMMFGTGELSADQKVLNWKFTYNCPITKKPTTMRQVETYTNKDAFTMEMFATDPHTNKEYKCMEIAFTRKAATASAAN